MPEERPLSADEVAGHQFATAFRGFDQNEVRAFLAQVASEVASLQERERLLRERLASAEAKPAAVPVAVDEEAMEAALGAETTRVIHAAREAAAEIRQRAEESVARMVREANAEASRLRHEAESVLAVRTEEAEQAALAIRAEAEAAAEELRASAAAAAAAAVDEAQQQGKEMVAEAQAVRQRMLSDLARRRAKAASQLEQLRAGRERLLAAYDVVRTTLEQATSELSVADSESRVAAEAAALRSAPELEGLDDIPDFEEPPPPPPPEPPRIERPAPAPQPAGGADEPMVRIVSGESPRPRAVPQPSLPAAEPPAASSPTDVGDEPAFEPVALSVVPAPEAEPAVPPSVPPARADVEGDERRSSALRLLRRKGEGEPAGTPPADEPMEGVRIIRPEPAAEAEPEVEVEAPAVDDLFARLRADRQASVEKAEAVLAAVDEPPAEPEPEAPAPDAVFEARDAAIEGSERALTRALKRALADEQNEVLDALRRLKGRPSVEAILADDDARAARYASAAAPCLQEGADAAGGSLDLGSLASAFGAEVAADLRGRVGRAVDQAGGDTEQLQDALNAAYREWKTSRAEPVGRHAVAAAYAAASFAGAPDGPLVWVVDRAEGGCPDCDDNALAGPTPKGDAFPTGQVHPPAHAGCRCLVVPAG